jgi:membrane-associated protein
VTVLHAALPQLVSAVHDVHAVHAAGGLALNPLSPNSILDGLGALGVFLILFAETGLLIGFFLPGDSLLFTAGLFCTTSATATVHLSLPLVLLAAAAGALLGAQVGFVIGQRAGTAVLARTKNQHLLRGAARGEELFARYGHAKAIVIGRFIPVVRTVLNPMAGGLGVSTRTFTTWQVAGGLLWSIGVTLAGYVLGSHIPGIDTYLLPIVAVIVIVSLIPLFLELRRARRESKAPAANGHSDATTAPAGERTPSSGL